VAAPTFTYAGLAETVATTTSSTFTWNGGDLLVIFNSWDVAGPGSVVINPAGAAVAMTLLGKTVVPGQTKHWAGMFYVSAATLTGAGLSAGTLTWQLNQATPQNEGIIAGMYQITGAVGSPVFYSTTVSGATSISQSIPQPTDTLACQVVYAFTGNPGSSPSDSQTSRNSDFYIGEYQGTADRSFTTASATEPLGWGLVVSTSAVLLTATFTTVSGSSDYGVSAETDAAVALVGSAHAVIGVATETGSAVALVGSERVVYGVVSETDTAVALAGSDHAAYGIASETGSAVGLTGSDHATLGIATETDTAVPLAGSDVVAFGVATETDESVALEAVGASSYGVATETDAAISPVGSDHAAYGVATESGAAVALVGSAHVAPGVASETDAAVALAGHVVGAWGIATETGVAIALVEVGAVPVVIAHVRGTWSRFAPGIHATLAPAPRGVAMQLASDRRGVFAQMEE